MRSRGHGRARPVTADAAVQRRAPTTQPPPCCNSRSLPSSRARISVCAHSALVASVSAHRILRSSAIATPALLRRRKPGVFLPPESRQQRDAVHAPSSARLNPPCTFPPPPTARKNSHPQSTCSTQRPCCLKPARWPRCGWRPTWSASFPRETLFPPTSRAA